MKKVPNGRAEVNAFYGNPSDGSGHLSTAWATKNLTYITLPYVLLYEGKPVTRIQAHRLAAPSFLAAFMAVWLHARLAVKERDGYDKDSAYYDAKSAAWLDQYGLRDYGGCFNFRPIRGAKSLSLHSYGIAIDFAVESNKLGQQSSTFPDWFVKCWEDQGFFWGMRFKGRKDPMHFQLAKNV